MSPATTVPVSAPRTRKWATKTRTGCITCRRRRIKCDEALPDCKRCVSTGRDCEGYTVIRTALRDTTIANTTSSSSFFSSIYDQPILSDGPAGVDANHAERGAFAMLRGECARRVAGLFSGSFWTVDVLRATHVYPAVWRAGLALAAMHRATCITAQTPAARAVRQRHERFALAQSQAAIVALLALTRRSAAQEGEEGAGRPTDPDKEAILLACTLFTGLCCLQEDYEQAAQHAKAGNRLYWRWKYWRHSGDEDEVAQEEDYEDDEDFTCTTRDYRADNHGVRRPGCVLTTKSLTAVFTHFEMQFCSRFLNIDIPEWRWRDRAHRCSSAPFTCAADAYTELQPLLTGYCHLERWLSAPRAPAELATVGRTVAAYSREMLTWRAKFAALLEHQGASLATLPPPPTDEDEDEEDEEAHRILCLRLLWMALETCFDQTEATGEMAWDARTPTLERVTSFAETHFAARWRRRRRRASPSSSPPTATTNRSFTFSFVMSACEVLTWIGTNCRDGGVRRRLIALLHDWPERDGIIDPRLLALVVHAVMVLEENATTGMQAPHEGCACEPGEEAADGGGGGKFICALHRVCLIDTRFLGERSATIVLTTTGMLKDGLPPYETSVSW